MKSIGIIGYFGHITNQIDGQTIKTRQIFKLISNKLGPKRLRWVDTQNLQYNKINTYFLLLSTVIKCNTIVYLPGQNNLKLFFPILYFLSRILNHDIIYPVVGGWLADFISSQPSLQKKLMRIKAILVESNNLKKKLEVNYGFKNVEVLTNFRLNNYIPYRNDSTSGLRIVFMARVTETKGCNTIFNIAHELSEKGYVDINFTFYGKIDSLYESTFKQKLESCSNCSYGGIVDPDNVYKVLNEYDVLILPTYYEGEGFPGTIVDAYKAGIPVIISNWKDLPEFVVNDKTGYIVDTNDIGGYVDTILNLYTNMDYLKILKQNAYEESHKYSANEGWKILNKYLN